MSSDIQGPWKSPETEKEEYMPYSCTQLTQALIDYARKYLNETEENRRKGVQEMKEFIQREIKESLDIVEIYCLCFLRTRKFDTKRACNLLKKGAEFVKAHRTLFDRCDPEAVRKTIQSNVIGFLPYRDAKGCAIVYVKSEYWDPSELKAEEVIFGSIVALHVAAENPVNQVAGFVLIIDFKNLNIKQVVAMSTWLIFGIQALQNCCPCLIKDIHVVHFPTVFKTTWQMLKPFISEKIRKRVTFYKSTNWTSLHRRISPTILPAELGGQLGPHSNEHWASDVDGIIKKYQSKISMYFDK